MASSYSDRDLDLVPHITFSFAENYIKSIKKSSGQKIFNKGFKYFHESYVCDLKVKPINDDSEVTGRCHRSKRKNDKPHELKLQLLELRTTNYELDAKCKKQDREIVLLKERADNTDKELQKALKAINKSKKAKEVEQLLQENETLQMKLHSQEDDFRLQNETLMQELSQLVSTNEDLEKQLTNATSDKTVPLSSSETTQLEDEIRRLQAQNTALQKNLAATQERYEKQLSELSGRGRCDSTLEEGDITHALSETETQEQESEKQGAGDEGNAPSTETVDDLKKTIADLRLNLDTEQEEKRILKEELASKEEKLSSECLGLREEIEKLTDKLKKKQDSFTQLQEEKESLYKDSSTKYEELKASKDRDQKYYTDQISRLQLEVQKYQKSQEEMKSSSGQTVRELETKMAAMQQQIDAANIVGHQQLQEHAQKYQVQINELKARMVSLTQQRDDLETQLKESQKASETASDQLRAITQDRDTQIQTLQEANKVAEKRKKMLDDLAIRYQKDCDKNREDMLAMEDRYEEELKTLRISLDTEKTRSSELDKQKELVEELRGRITSLEEGKGWLERRLAETEETLKTTTEDYKTTVESMKVAHEEELIHLKSLHGQEITDLKTAHDAIVQESQAREESQQKTVMQLEEDNKRLKQEIKDGVDDKKIHEKKGKSVLKDLKKQLHAERKRAEKLQERLEAVLTESGHNKSIEDLFRASEMNDSWREDRSSVSSWSAGASGAGTFTSFNTSLSAMSSSPSPQSPMTDLPGTLQDESTMVEENSQLLSRIAELQQEKWNLEEKVRHLETSTAAMADDLIEKARIIEHYVMESRTDTKPHTPVQHEDKISLKKVLDLVNKSDDQGLKDMNKKLQNMLEETLTKNMHLQKDMETLSQEIVRLSKLDSAVNAVKNNSKDKTNAVTSTLPAKKNSLQETNTTVIPKEADVS